MEKRIREALARLRSEHRKPPLYIRTEEQEERILAILQKDSGFDSAECLEELYKLGSPAEAELANTSRPGQG